MQHSTFKLMFYGEIGVINSYRNEIIIDEEKDVRDDINCAK